MGNKKGDWDAEASFIQHFKIPIMSGSCWAEKKMVLFFGKLMVMDRDTSILRDN